MPNLNTCQLMGNLTRSPELKYLPSGSAVAEVGLAINRHWRDNDGKEKTAVTFLDITFFGKQAETIAKYLEKGSPVFVQGRIQVDSWDDKQTGQKRYKTRIIGESFQFLSGKKKQEDSDNDGEQEEEAPPPRKQKPAAKPAPKEEDEFANADDDLDDVPF